jgi:hypothetical protein
MKEKKIDEDQTFPEVGFGLRFRNWISRHAKRSAASKYCSVLPIAFPHELNNPKILLSQLKTRIIE